MSMSRSCELARHGGIAGPSVRRELLTRLTSPAVLKASILSRHSAQGQDSPTKNDTKSGGRAPSVDNLFSVQGAV